MTRGEKLRLLQLVYRLEVAAVAAGVYHVSGVAGLSESAEAECVRLRGEIEHALGFANSAAATMPAPSTRAKEAAHG